MTILTKIYNYCYEQGAQMWCYNAKNKTINNVNKHTKPPTMKRLLLALAAIASIAFGSYAQKTQVYASYGGYTQMDATDCHDGWHGVNKAWGSLNLGADFMIAPGLRIGPSYSFSSSTTKAHYGKIGYHTVLFNLKYDYYRSGMFKLYGHAGVGAVISHLMPEHLDSYNKTHVAYQIAPLAAEAAISNNFSLFGELGFGAQGLVQFGVKYNL